MNGKGSRNRVSNHKEFRKRHDLIFSKPENIIPNGEYCYRRLSSKKIELCPYWSRDNSQPEQMNGYCHFLKRGDWESDELSLLWDQCKECNINIEEK